MVHFWFLMYISQLQTSHNLSFVIIFKQKFLFVLLNLPLLAPIQTQSTIESQKQGRRGRTLCVVGPVCTSYSDCTVSTNPCEYGNGICNLASNSCKYAHIDGCVNGATLDTWWNVPGDDLIELKSDSQFPDHPDLTVSLTERLERETWNRGNNFGARLHTCLMAPLTCDFNFYISSDNDGEINLSTDTDPQTKWRSPMSGDTYPLGVGTVK